MFEIYWNNLNQIETYWNHMKHYETIWNYHNLSHTFTYHHIHSDIIIYIHIPSYTHIASPLEFGGGLGEPKCRDTQPHPTTEWLKAPYKMVYHSFSQWFMLIHIDSCWFMFNTVFLSEEAATKWTCSDRSTVWVVRLEALVAILDVSNCAFDPVYLYLFDLSGSFRILWAKASIL